MRSLDYIRNTKGKLRKCGNSFSAYQLPDAQVLQSRNSGQSLQETETTLRRAALSSLLTKQPS